MSAKSLQAFRRDIDFFLDEALSKEGRREIFIAAIRPEIQDFDDAWRQVLGRAPQTQTFVDGKETRDLSQVMIPGGAVVHRVRPVSAIVDRAVEIIDTLTKTVTGGYKAKNTVLVNDRSVGFSNPEPNPTDEVALVNFSAFSRKAEVRAYNDRDDSGFRKGLFESAAAILKREFRAGLVPIRFTFRQYEGERLPAIIIN